MLLLLLLLFVIKIRSLIKFTASSFECDTIFLKWFFVLLFTFTFNLVLIERTNRRLQRNDWRSWSLSSCDCKTVINWLTLLDVTTCQWFIEFHNDNVIRSRSHSDHSALLRLTSFLCQSVFNGLRLTDVYWMRRLNDYDYDYSCLDFCLKSANIVCNFMKCRLRGDDLAITIKWPITKQPLTEFMKRFTRS